MTMAMTMTTMTLDDVGNSSSRRQRELATLTLPDDCNDDDCNDDDEKKTTTTTTTTTTILMMSNATDDEEKEDAYDAFEYQPSNIVMNMHRAPRGIHHTNRIATLLAAAITGSTSNSNSTVNSTGNNNTAAASNSNSNSNLPPFLSLLSSSSLSYITNNEYTNGIKLFIGLFVITPFLLWIILLLGFKFIYGSKKGCSCINSRTIRVRARSGRGSLLRHRSSDDANANEDKEEHGGNEDSNNNNNNNNNNVIVETTTEKSENNKNTKNNNNILNNWIAGGDIINMIKLSKGGISRSKRKQYVLRSWRIQSIYMIISILIPIISIVLIEVGWKNIEQNILYDIQKLNYDIDTLAYSGYNSIQNIYNIKQNLFNSNSNSNNNNSLIQLLLEYSNNNNNNNNENNNNNVTQEEEHNNVIDENDRKKKNDDNNDNDNENDNDNNHNIIGSRSRSRYLQQQQQPQETTTAFPTSFDSSIDGNGDGDDDDDGFDPWNDFFGGVGTEEGTINPTTTTSTSTSIITVESSTITEETNKTLPLLVVTTKPQTLPPPPPPSTAAMNNNTSTTIPPTKGITRISLIEQWCPNAYEYINDVDELIVWTDSINIFSNNTNKINSIFNSLLVVPTTLTTTTTDDDGSSTDDDGSSTDDDGYNFSSQSFLFITETTNYIDIIIEWFFNNDWLLKLMLLVLNVVNFLMLINVYFISKNNIIHYPIRHYISYIIMPIFILSTIFILFISIISGIVLLINVDFCSGGSTTTSYDDAMTMMMTMNTNTNNNNNTNNNFYYGSPKGTIEDVIMILQKQQQQQLPTVDYGQNNDDSNSNNNIDDGLDLLYDAVQYFWTGCLTENPLYFLEEFSNDIDEAAARLNQLTTLLPITATTTTTTASTAILSGQKQQEQQLVGDNGTSTPSANANANATTTTTTTLLDKLNDACQRDMSFLPIAIDDLKKQIDRMKININKLSDTVSCGEISPLLRRVSHGSICVEAPYALTILWSTSFSIAVLCFILVTVRAALYNSVKQKKRRLTKPRRIVEKEFDEYKIYMSKHYGIKETNEWNIDGDGNGDGDGAIPLVEEGLIEEEEEYTSNNKPTKMLEFVFDNNVDLEIKSTFETAITTKGSGTIISDNDYNDNDRYNSNGDDDRDRDDVNNDGSEYNAGNIRMHMIRDDSSYGSSYDSEISDDDDDNSSDDDNDDDEQSSAIGSFMSAATKSSAAASALQIIHSIRNVKSLLLSSSKSKATTSSSSTKTHNKKNEHYQRRGEQQHHQGVVYGDDDEDDDGDTGVRTHKDNNDSRLLFPPKVIETSFEDAADADDSNDEVDDDDDRLDVSISDDSLYLPTPTNVGVRAGTGAAISCFDGRQGVAAASTTYHSSTRGRSSKITSNRSNEKDTSISKLVVHPTPTTTTSRIIEALLTPSSVISALSPIAPRKAFTFLARTKAKLLYGSNNDNYNDDDTFFDEKDYTEEELNSLVQPKQLSTLTPFRSRKQDDTSRRTADNIEQTTIQPTTRSNHRYSNSNSNGYTTTTSVDSTDNNRAYSVSEKELTKLPGRSRQPLSLSKDTGKIDEKKSLLDAVPSFTSTLPSSSSSSHLRGDVVKRKHYYGKSNISRKDFSTNNNNNNNDNDITNNSSKSSRAQSSSGQRSSHDKNHYAAAKKKNGLGSSWPTDDSATAISSSLQRRPDYPIYRTSQSSQLTSTTATTTTTTHGRNTGTAGEAPIRRAASAAAAASSSSLLGPAKISGNFHYHTDSRTTRSRPKK